VNPWHFYRYESGSVDPEPLSYGFGYWFYCFLLFEDTHHSSKIKSTKTVHRNQGFSYFFSLIMERFGTEQIMADPDPRGPLTYGSNGSESGSTTLVGTLKIVRSSTYLTTEEWPQAV
jgi:hypothetical protein